MPLLSALSGLLSAHARITPGALVLNLAMCASVAHAAGPTGLLNDTGQTRCADASNALVACNAATTGDSGVLPRQDGRFGRDVANPAKVGGGAAGFDFTKLCWNGDPQGSGTCTGILVANGTGTPTGTPTTDWACNRDNVTNLVWSLQIQAATWNNATVSTYPDAGHNTATRCGFATGWRLPTRRELLSIVHHGLPDYSTAKIDVAYFPNTPSGYYWTSDAYAPPLAYAWLVDFNVGYSFGYYRTGTNSVRLVRSGP